MSDLIGSDFIKKGFLDEEIDKMEKMEEATKKAMKTVQQEAKKAAKALGKTNAAQKEGQDEIEKAESRTKDLIKAQEKYERTLDGTEQELVKLKQAQSEANRLNKLTVKLNNSAEGSYDRLSAQYSLNKVQLNAMSTEQRKVTKSGQVLEKQTKELYEGMKDLQEATGKHQLSVGDYAGKLGELVPAVGAAKGALQGLGAQMWALVANPVGAIIAAVAAAAALLWKAFQATTGGAEFLATSMATLGTIFDTIIGRLGQFITGQISFTELLFDSGDAMRENVTAARELVRARKELENQTALNTMAEAALEKQIAKLQGIRDSDANSMSARQKAAKALTKLEVAQSQIRVDQAMEEARIAQLNLRKIGTKETVEFKDAQNELRLAFANLNMAQAENIRVQAESANQLEMIRLDIFDQELDLLLDITDRQKTINETRIKDETLSMEVRRRLAEENIEMIERDYLKQIAAFETLNGVRVDEVGLLKMTGSEILKYADRLGFSERAVNRLREVVMEKITADQDNLDSMKALDAFEKKQFDDSIKRAEDLLKSEREGALITINEQKDLANSEIDLLVETEEVKTRLRLEAERERLRQVIAINEVMGGDLSDIQIQTMKNAIAKIDQVLGSKEKEEGRKDIYSLLGLKVNDDEKQKIAESAAFIKQNLMDIANTRLQTAQQVTEASERGISRAQQELQTQIELKEAGLRADIEGAQMRLTASKKNNAEAIKEQQKAQKLSSAIEAASQIGSMITASANIFKTLSPLGPLGIVLAVASIGSMFASFAATKVQARKAARFGKGGSFDIDGGSHASRNDVGLGVHGGTEIRAEGGEKGAIFSKSALKKYGSNSIDSVIDSINNGTYEHGASGTFTPLSKMPDYMTAGSGGFNSEEMKQFFREENARSEKALANTVKNIPQPIWGVSQGRLTKAMKIGNQTYLDVRQENNW
jgi:hypothetical protein